LRTLALIISLALGLGCWLGPAGALRASALAAPQVAAPASAGLEQPRAVKVTPSEAPMAAQGEQRVALVIGNAAYGSSPLKNPVNDARAMKAVLEACGFQVIQLENADHRQIREALREFGIRLARGGVGLFYYAGHGIQVKGKNYLVPIAADIEYEDEIPGAAIDVDSILAKLESAKNRLNIVVLDACRDNPFARSFRSAGHGLAPLDAPTGTFIAFATAPGRTAADGGGANGLYTEQLLAVLPTPGLKLEDAFKRVLTGVRKASDDRQIPWTSSSVEGDFYFVPGGGTRPMAGPLPVGPAPVNPFLRQAQGAFDSGHFADPEGDNAIEWARRVQRDAPDDPTARDLIAQSAKACENQAKLALAKDGRETALRIYQRLFTLFPQNETYLDAIMTLEKPAPPKILGSWNWSVRSIFVPDRTCVVMADGTCTLNGMGGTWSSQKGEGNKIIFRWNDNWTHTMVLSEDGLAMIGKDDWGTKVTGRRIIEGNGGGSSAVR
jgi:uncharacterized caspase-like protein